MTSNASDISASSMSESAKALQDELVANRRRIHSHPELSFREVETAKFIAEQLRAYGYQVIEGIAGTGIIADLGTGKTIAIRSEMDALPLAEQNRLMFTSKVPGVMHACGHDAHVACVLGAAKLLSQSILKGRVRLIFQPGEEVPDQDGKTGAFRMIEHGALDTVDGILGMHVDSTIPSHRIGVVAGALTAVVQEFVLTIAGSASVDANAAANTSAASGAEAATTADTAVAASHILQSLFDLKPKMVTASEPILLSIGSVRSEGDTPAGHAGTVVIKGSFKTFGDEMRIQISSEIDKICQSIDSVSTSVQFRSGATNFNNERSLTDLVQEVGNELLGAQNVLSIKRRSWASDFSLYTERVPGAFIYLGAEIAHNRRIHHSATFDIDESGLHIAAAVLAESVVRFWLKPSASA